MFSVFFDMYVDETGDAPAILDSETVKNTLAYPRRAHLGGGRFLPFADGGLDNIIFDASYICAMKNLFSDAVDVPDVDPFMLDGRARVQKALGYQRILSLKHLREKTDCKREESSFYFPSGEVFVRRAKKYAFTAKCGTNFEPHNHNDVGVFEIVRNKERLIWDIGAGEYTNDYFNGGDRRYGKEIFVCGSLSHSVPVVDGKYQLYGKDYYGRVLNCDENSFAADIARAYADPPDSFTVKYRCNENFVEAAYELKSDEPRQITYRFVSECKPTAEKDCVRIGTMTVRCDRNITPILTEEKYRKHNSEQGTAYVIDYVCEKKTADKILFVFSFDDD